MAKLKLLKPGEKTRKYKKLRKMKVPKYIMWTSLILNVVLLSYIILTNIIEEPTFVAY